MTIAAVLLAAIAGLWWSPAAAQAPTVCTACIAAQGCDSNSQACVAGCRARYFIADPQRDQCTAQCTAAAARCARTAEASCRTQNACR